LTRVFQHAAARRCLSKAPPNTSSLSEKEKIFVTKATVTCKRSAAVKKCCKKLTSKTKSKSKLLQVFIGPVHFVVATENTSNPLSQLFHK